MICHKPYQIRLFFCKPLQLGNYWEKSKVENNCLYFVISSAKGDEGDSRSFFFSGAARNPAIRNFCIKPDSEIEVWKVRKVLFITQSHQMEILN